MTLIFSKEQSKLAILFNLYNSIDVHYPKSASKKNVLVDRARKDIDSLISKMEANYLKHVIQGKSIDKLKTQYERDLAASRDNLYGPEIFPALMLMMIANSEETSATGAVTANSS